MFILVLLLATLFVAAFRYASSPILGSLKNVTLTISLPLTLTFILGLALALTLTRSLAQSLTLPP